MSEEQPTIDELRKLVVQAYVDLDVARFPPEHMKDPTNQRWFNACEVRRLAQGLYDTEATRIYKAMPFPCQVFNTYNERGQVSTVKFGDAKLTYHIVPLKAYTKGAFVRPQGQPLCRVMKCKPAKPAGWQDLKHGDLPTCHACLVRAEKIIAAEAKP